jgi:hypothetical protein
MVSNTKFIDKYSQTQQFIYCKNIPCSQLILYQMNAVHTLPYCFFENNLILFSPLCVGLPNDLLSSVFWRKSLQNI